MKKFLLFAVFFVFVFSFAHLSIADTSNIAKLAFITEPQTVSPNTVSKYITLQIQDASGNQVVALETIRFDAFQTTSPSGAFVSCTTPTNPPTDYMSKNSSNKNICYKDSTEGVYTITAKTSNTAIPMVATQMITVLSAVPPASGTSTTSTSTDNTDTTGTTTSTTTAITGGGSYHVYSSPSYISTYEPVSLNVDAGRERLGFLHVPMQFKASALDKKTGSHVLGVRYTWTFGDGFSAEGSDVNHIYLFPGEYNVVLNSYSGNEEAVDITKVKIVAPLVNVTASNSYVEFANNSSSDLNIGGWKINGNEKEYYIPKDTIISTRSTLKIPSIVADHVFEDNIISVLYPDGQILIEIAKTPSEEKKRQIAEISQRLTELKSELDLAYVIGDESEPPNTGQEMKIIANADVAPGSTAENDIGVIANAESAKVSQNVLSKIVDFFATMFR